MLNRTSQGCRSDQPTARVKKGRAVSDATAVQEQGARRVYINKASPESYQAFRRAAEAVHAEAVAAGLA